MHPRFESRIAALVWVACASALGAGCNEPSERPSRLETLRVVAVRADHPFAPPGSEVRLDMLLYDGAPEATRDDGSRRPVHVLWMASCLNASGDLYYECYPELHRALAGVSDADLAAERIPEGLTPTGSLGFGTSFRASIPADAIASRPQALSTAYPYGLLHVFFMACAGDLRVVPHADPNNAPPVGCFRTGTDEPLTQRDFEFGYYPIYLYDTLLNQNPSIAPGTFGTVAPGPSCADASECGGGYVCGSHGACIPTVAPCAATEEKDCPAYALAPVVDRSSVEISTSARLRTDSAPPETLWIDYYGSAGRFDKDSRIIQDAAAGWFDQYEGLWRPYQVASGREVELFAIVHDSRGGVNWISQSVWVR